MIFEMSIKEDLKQRQLYANLMDEVKVRIDSIDRALRGQTGFAGPLVREYCYLQLRLLCELIGLACLVAHGDKPATQSGQLGKEWSADAIIKALEKLRPHFYPIPVIQTTTPIPGTENKHHHLQEIDPQPFPKEALLGLYGDTHRYLHRGNVTKLLNSDTPIEPFSNFQDVNSWAQKINDQLQNHLIFINEKEVIACVLRNRDDNMRVQVVTASAPARVKEQPA
jgi:hypothetical protein